MFPWQYFVFLQGNDISSLSFFTTQTVTGLKSNQILTSYYQSFVLLLHQHNLRAGHHCRFQGFQLVLCLSLSSVSLQSSSRRMITNHVELKGLGRYYLAFSVVNKFLNVLFFKRVLSSVLKSNQQPWQQPLLFKGFHGVSLTSSSIIYNLLLTLAVSLGGKGCLDGGLSLL